MWYSSSVSFLGDDLLVEPAGNRICVFDGRDQLMNKVFEGPTPVTARTGGAWKCGRPCGWYRSLLRMFVRRTVTLTVTLTLVGSQLPCLAWGGPLQDMANERDVPDYFGVQAILLPDCNSDGFSDLAVLEGRADGSKTLWVISGQNRDVLIEFGPASDALRFSVDGMIQVLRDVNGDDVPEILARGKGTDGVSRRFLFSPTNPPRVLQVWGRDLVSLVQGSCGGEEQTWAIAKRQKEQRIVLVVSSVGGTSTSTSEVRLDLPEESAAAFGSQVRVLGLGGTSCVAISQDDSQTLGHLFDLETGELLQSIRLAGRSGLAWSIRSRPGIRGSAASGSLAIGGYLQEDDSLPSVALYSLGPQGLAVRQTWGFRDVFQRTSWASGVVMFGASVHIVKCEEGVRVVASDREAFGGSGVVALLGPGDLKVVSEADGVPGGFAGRIAGGADWDGDGVEDFVVSPGYANGLGPEIGFVDIRSGATGKLLDRVRRRDIPE